MDGYTTGDSISEKEGFIEGTGPEPREAGITGFILFRLCMMVSPSPWPVHRAMPIFL